MERPGMEGAKPRRSGAKVLRYRGAEGVVEPPDGEKSREELLAEIAELRAAMTATQERGGNGSDGGDGVEAETVAGGAVQAARGGHVRRGRGGGATRHRSGASVSLTQQVGFLRAALASLDECVLAMDHLGRLTYMNAAAERVFGWHESEVRWRSAVELIVHGGAQGSCPLLEVLRGREAVQFDDGSFARRDGTPFPARGSVVPLFKDGTLTDVLIILRDDTGRIKEERRTAARERQGDVWRRQLEAVLEHMREGVVIFDAESAGARSNQAAERLLGVGADGARKAHLAGEGDAHTEAAALAAVKGLAERGAPILGFERTLDYQTAPIWDADEGRAGTVVFVREAADERRRREAARSAELLESAFAASAAGLMMFSSEGRLLRLNDAAYDLLEVPPEQRRAFLRLPREEMFARIRRRDGGLGATPAEPGILSQIWRGEGMDSSDDALYTLDSADCGERVLQVSHATVSARSGDAYGQIVSLWDVTELLRLETELREARRAANERAQQLAAAFRVVADSIVLQDREGRIRTANAAARRTLGLDDDPSLGALPVLERAKRFSVRDVQGQPIPLQATPVMRALRGEQADANAVEESELLLRRLGGVERRMQVRSTRIEQADGALAGAMTVFRDVTPLREAERTASERAQRLEATFESLSDGVVIYGRDGKVEMLNAAARALFGSTGSDDHILTPMRERLGRYGMLAADGSPLPFERLPVARVLAGERITGAAPARIVFINAGGRRCSLSVTGTPLLDELGQVRGAVLIVREVPEE